MNDEPQELQDSASPAIDLDVPPDLARKAVAAAAEAWGADWRPGINGGSLDLPIAAGIRRGSMHGEVRIETGGGGAGGSRVRFLPGEATYQVQSGAVVVLLLAAVGGVMTVVWPFFPALLPLAPLGALIALSGWFLVVSRLTTNTPEDFLRLVQELAQADGDDAPDPRPPI